MESFADQTRIRRSGSVDFLGPIKKKLASGLKSKLGEIAHGSAGAISGLSKSGDHDAHGHYFHETPHVSYYSYYFTLSLI